MEDMFFRFERKNLSLIRRRYFVIIKSQHGDGFTLPPPTYSFVMNHPETCNATQPNSQDNDQPDTQRSSTDRVTFGLPSSQNIASSSTGTLPPSYSSLQLTNFQGIQPSIIPS
ncbi:hypothetical protein KUTeg_020948 [Tegillarca granosa]|uniref:Uncharacterized protein n=1 Tax=Tegillarca granosa TaxID=220873 RepID=A0ABQ9EDP3_TEGGR|nr:hypothetical protein KUTeg_020948 [Tegillarca granosa]